MTKYSKILIVGLSLATLVVVLGYVTDPLVHKKVSYKTFQENAYQYDSYGIETDFTMWETVRYHEVTIVGGKWNGYKLTLVSSGLGFQLENKEGSTFVNKATKDEILSSLDVIVENPAVNYLKNYQ